MAKQEAVTMILESIHEGIQTARVALEKGDQATALAMIKMTQKSVGSLIALNAKGESAK